ncbi:hypothetical protein [Desulfovibrio sp. 86]|jgi:hypothetical protein|uniref:Uncharacterized protein n=1 Tax=uncultured Desulfovibrio sp. TaxID=167968 RepID=A0A212L9S5_9BACT|nr:hypothetical protein [Desulfovibrio sp. 86]SCM74334.1 hypothetical protein KL86DES1_21874 [uncultured Desulfovibrio sp.]VZH34770.1 conserved protein of unknown function [Desulfovibrio sp. 86]
MLFHTRTAQAVLCSGMEQKLCTWYDNRHVLFFPIKEARHLPAQLRKIRANGHL